MSSQLKHCVLARVIKVHSCLGSWPFGPPARSLALGSHCCLESIGSCSALPTMLLYSSSGKRLDWFLWNTDVGTLASLRLISSSACWNCGWDAAWSLHVLLHVEAPSSTPCIFEAHSARHGSLNAALYSTHIYCRRIEFLDVARLFELGQSVRRWTLSAAGAAAAAI